jgi:hypothetical protein
MNYTNRISSLCLFVVAVFPASLCWASINPDTPPAITVGSITYLNGGRDVTQATAMRSEAARYPLELDFLWGRGAKETPIGNVDWSIQNAAGHRLLDASSNGPLVLASLPNGRYRVTARYQDRTLSRVVNVRQGTHETVLLEWPQ